MIGEQVIWTALPKGFDSEGRLIVSVHVAPRLTDDASSDPHKLGEFPSFVDWPARLSALEFDVDLDGTTAHATPLEKADSDLWTHLFPDDTFVRPHQFTDHATRTFHVFPVRDVLQFVEATYGALAAAGPDLPSIDDPSGPLAAFGPLEGIAGAVEDSESYVDELDRAITKAKAGGTPPGEPGGPGAPVGTVAPDDVAAPSLSGNQQNAQNALFQAYRFYHRPGSQRPPEYIEPPPAVPDFDFHDVVSLLADHPVLLRRLGLVIDLVVEEPDPTGAFAGQGVVRVIPKGELPEDPPRCPGTRYELDHDWFGARPLHSHRMKRGLLNLTQEFWDLFQVDVDGAALQAVGFGGTLSALLDPELRNAATPGETGAPALRSGGLALARVHRGDTLLDDLVGRRDANSAIENGSPLPSGAPVEFDAGDLVRGYRVDVWDQDATGGPRWRSLHERETRHDVTGLPDGIEPITDEGYVKSTAASSEREDNQAPSDDLYLHETVVAWDGWSLAAPRPGKRIVEPGEGTDGSSVADYDPAADQILPIVSSVRVAPGTLPRLRIGHTYKLRIRTVDIAGNSRPVSPEDFEPADPDLESEAQLYVRFEPVPSPALLRRHLDTEGESLEHLVIRSDVGMSAAAYATSPGITAVLAEAGAPYAYAADSQRHIAAPKGSQQMAEADGRFEDAFGGSGAAMTTALRLALREEGTFLDRKIINPATGKKTVNQAAIEVFPAGASLPIDRGAERGSGLAADPGDTKLRGAYAFYPDPTLKLPYLPDPLAIGVALIGVDFDGKQELYQDALFADGWPAPTPIRVQLSEGPRALKFVGGVLEVTLPQAEVLHARLSSVFPADRLDHFAIWQWTPEEGRTDELETAAHEGRHWMLTPSRRVTFTHAVQRPLAVPDMTGVTSARVLGSTFAEFRGPIVNHARSTGRLDVFGEWTEDVDLLTDEAPRMRATGDPVAHAGHAFGFDITPGEDAAQVTKPGTPAKPPDLPLPTADRIARHEFGDTKYRRVVYHSVATTRFREFLPRAIADDPSLIQTVEEPPLTGDEKIMRVHHVLSSARPAAPEVLYAVPTFRWDRSDKGTIRAHVRRGRSVRVWLRRPWFSSGDDELLAVVLEPTLAVPGTWTVDHAAIDLQAQATRLSGAAGTRFGPVHRSAARKSNAAARHLVEVNQPLTGAELVKGPYKVGMGSDLVIGSQPTAKEIAAMLQPYVTKFGSDPVWASAVPDVVPTPADFPRRVATKGNLTLEELPSAAQVTVAAHEVEFDPVRKLWSCDIEIDVGDSYFPFVRLALARFQPHSLDGVHVSRVVMTDFMQVAPDRTAQLTRARGGYGIVVRGYAGRNYLGDLSGASALIPELAELDAGTPRPNTTMRAAVERRPPGIPGDLGWERVGPEVTLTPVSTSNFHVTWTGSIAPPAAPEGHAQRIVITEIETFPRDPLPGDPPSMSSLLDRVRERIVYVDTFDL